MKKIQHFIPKFILRRFVSEDGKFKFVDKRYGPSNKSPDGAMYKEFFYEHNDLSPNEIEDLLSIRENVYAPIIQKIIDRNDITLDEHQTLLEFRHVTYYRSNEFIGFHRYSKKRGENDWIQRNDWKVINGIFKSDNYEADIKKTQLKAIQSTINRDDAAFYMSSLTPICFVFTSKSKKFAVGDNGSLCWGSDFEGGVLIVVSPHHTIMFPRVMDALKMMKVFNVTNQESTIIYEEADDEAVDMINQKVFEDSFEYYIDPN